MRIANAAASIRLFLVAILLGPLPADAASERRVALIIGNAAYLKIARLQKPINDAQKMAEVLRTLGFDVTAATNVSAQDLANLVSNFRSALRSADVGFFFYSGHGFQSSRIEQQHPVNHIVPVDFNPDLVDIASTTLALDAVLDALKEARVGFVFMDACRSDPQLTEASQRLTRGTRSVTITRGFSPIRIKPPTTIAAPPRKGPAGLLIAYATDPGNVALEGEAGLYSPFTGSLAKHLVTPGLSASEVMGRVSTEVSTSTQGQQTPWNVSSLTAGTYKFLPESPATTTQSRPDARTYSLSVWPSMSIGRVGQTVYSQTKFGKLKCTVIAIGRRECFWQ